VYHNGSLSIYLFHTEITELTRITVTCIRSNHHSYQSCGIR